MRRTSIGAAQSIQLPVFDYVGVRNWIVFVFSGLLLGLSEVAAASQSHREVRFTDDSVVATGGAVYAPARSAAGPDATPTPTLGPESSPVFTGADYWDALAELDLSALHSAAEGNAQLEFARGISLLADGDTEAAERVFIAGSEQRSDSYVGIASQIMLATTLLYEHKWAELRSLSFSQRLSPADMEIIRGYQRWGFAFANTESQRLTMSADSALMRMGLSAIGTPTIGVRINGKRYNFWLDTGSSITVLSSAVAEEVGVPVVSADSLAVRTFSGSAPVKAGFVRRLEIGPVLLENTPAVVVDDSHMALQPTPGRAQTTRMHIDGIIGWDTIRQLDLSLDYLNGLIVIRRPERSNYSLRNLTWMGKPFVEVRTKRGQTLHFTLDTGAQSSFLNGLVLDKTGVAATTSDALVFGIAGTGRRANKAIRTLPLEIGGKSVRLDGVMVYGPTYSGMINCDGILGSDVARYGTIRVDATNGVFAIGLNPLRVRD